VKQSVLLQADVDGFVSWVVLEPILRMVVQVGMIHSEADVQKKTHLGNAMKLQ